MFIRTELGTIINLSLVCYVRKIHDPKKGYQLTCISPIPYAMNDWGITSFKTETQIDTILECIWEGIKSKKDFLDLS